MEMNPLYVLADVKAVCFLCLISSTVVLHHSGCQFAFRHSEGVKKKKVQPETFFFKCTHEILLTKKQTNVADS